MCASWWKSACAIRPVSYTHLDVYKRQLSNSAERPSRAFVAGIVLYRTVLGHRFVQPVTAGKVIAVVPVSRKNPAGQVTAQAAVTVDKHRLAGRNLIQAVAQLVERNMDKAFYVPLGPFGVCAYDFKPSTPG